MKCIRDQPFSISLMEQTRIPLSSAQLGNVWVKGVKVWSTQPVEAMQVPAGHDSCCSEWCSKVYHCGGEQHIPQSPRYYPGHTLPKWDGIQCDTCVISYY